MLSCIYTAVIAEYVPVVLMHGLTDSVSSSDLLAQVIREEVPGIYVKECEVGNGGQSSVLMDFR